MLPPLKSLIKKVTPHPTISAAATHQRPSLKGMDATPIYDRGTTEQVDISKYYLSGLSSIEKIRDSMVESSNKLNHELETIDRLNEKSHSAHKGIIDLVMMIGTIESQSIASLAQIDALNKHLDRVNTDIVNIDKLSNQTNLLAINSGIEAAHVGQTGAGFSVIAKEVKTISHNIQQQASHIGQLVRDVTAQSRGVGQAVQLNCETAKRIKVSSDQAKSMIQEVIEQSTRMQSIIRFITTQQFLNTVKLDHVIWKGNVYKLLVADNHQDGVNDHMQCRLGKWYYQGEGARHFASIPSFRQLEKPHQQVHAQGKQALQAYRDNDEHAMQRALEQMEHQSNLVIECVDHLLADISRLG